MGFETRGRAIEGVVTSRGTIKTSRVVNAAGAWSPGIARMLGVELPNKPHRHEICASEPLKPFLGPLVADLSNGLYFSQSMRGEIVGGVSNDDVPHGLDHGSSHRFLALYAKAILAACPRPRGIASSVGAGLAPAPWPTIPAQGARKGTPLRCWRSSPKPARKKWTWPSG